MKIGAIDIGSNAARLLIHEYKKLADGTDIFIKTNFLRIPVRLGLDVFEFGKITENRQTLLINTLKVFKDILNIYDVKHYFVIATSAMRDASNKESVLAAVKKFTNLNIEIIDGNKEAKLTFDSHIADNLDPKFNYMYIDVGGGSTEISFFNNKQLVYAESFNLGTLRTLKKGLEPNDIEKIKSTLIKNINATQKIIAIGVGGNINKASSICKANNQCLQLNQLIELYNNLKKLSLEQRINKYKLKEDRADVIVPALQIFIFIMQTCKIKKIFVPQISLTESLIKNVAQNLNK
ncbi:MAG: exopolyphosphatase [Alphaproteobacteria bacterium]|nr:exopolyphosphatase [Alphaproteobacteria bacterium]